MSLKSKITSRWISQAIRFPSFVPKGNLTPSQAMSMPNFASSMSSFRTISSFPARNPSLKGLQSSGRIGSRLNFTHNFPASLQRSTFRRFNSSRPNSKAQSGQSGSLSQRLKTLSREYGWAALGVYLLLSAMDFPFCFIAVRQLGVERIGHYEDIVVGKFKSIFGMENGPEETGEGVASSAQSEGQQAEEAQKKTNGDGASLWTQLAIAYAVHKSLIFIRVPLTAAITPKVVRALRIWGWDLAKGKPRGM
ncbi:FAM210 family protein [Aspergillus clavatus NRRL 1]|uniref:Peptide alpha-N-acetyltransferase Nat2, putative n=1 Tax=Aspergillus clavatus (strain ATCC 1007 / CBS 513.65 / DSM 816 / NCTC 3887 / NRRL 1 / QM 1276 / 107) TaxID=344612 RepID=A1CGR0_ASPCL|nr:peptide alpha-N-acetyltransferase Nat2, putative [Aspergillus clavatus NRRL 1]EAW10065.1 peptide alpha-N-acetyltransferase Nat2, putative [Aspergillus clavatus NRRL 1]